MLVASVLSTQAATFSWKEIKLGLHSLLSDTASWAVSLPVPANAMLRLMALWSSARCCRGFEQSVIAVALHPSVRKEMGELRF